MASLDERIPAEECFHTSGYDQCTDTNYDAAGNELGDSYGDPCSLYYGNSGWCGGYDTADFNSAEMCCVCGGGDWDGSAPNEFTLEDLETVIDVVDVIKSDLVTGDHRPMRDLDQLTQFVNWTEDFEVPFAYGQRCTVRGKREAYRFTRSDGITKHHDDYIIFYLNGECDESESVWVRFKKGEKFWRKFATMYNGPRSEFVEDEDGETKYF